MPRLSVNLLPSIAAELDNSPKDVDGEKYRGDGYYGYSDGLHTVAHYVDGFVGRIEIQGTLAHEPTDSDWVVLAVTEELNPGTPLTESTSYNFTGNFVWVRAVVRDITYGSIVKVQMNY